MSKEENKALMRRYYEDFFNNGNSAIGEELLSPNIDHVAHGAPPGTPPGPEGAIEAIGRYRAGFPDLRVTIEDIVAEGDKVACRVTFRGTHKGEFQGIAPTNKQVTVTAISINRIDGDKIVERSVLLDRMSLMQQLGAVPKPGQAK